MKFFLLTATLLLLASCGDSSQTNNLCNPNPCTLPHKTVCSVENDKSICSCEEGHIPSGIVCVKAEICGENSCGINENCNDSTDKIVCECKENFIKDGETCVFDCSNILNSKVNSTNDGCDCNEDYIKDELNNCIFDVNQLCNPNSCKSNEICSIEGNNYVCNCKNGYTNENDICVFDCSETENSHVNSSNNGCVCDTDYHLNNGNCIENVNPCENNPCIQINKNICTATGNEVDDFTCSCNNGYHLNGNTCVQTVNPCNPNLCTQQNKNVCTATGNEAGQYTCSCNQGFVSENGVCVEYQMPEGCQRYSSVLNLTGTQLISELNRITGDGFDGVGYDSAREHMYNEIDNINGKNQCVYTGVWYSVGSGVNCEHTWPQSRGADGDAKSDIHHLFPTNPGVNSSRSNLPFGIVVEVASIFCNSDNTYCSKRGQNANGVTVFEPANQHKGDLARAMFYFAVRYENPTDFINNQQEVLKQWNILDPVDQKEINRNNAIEQIQNNRNPFVDCPQLINQLGNF